MLCDSSAGLCPIYSWQEIMYHKGVVMLPEIHGTWYVFLHWGMRRCAMKCQLSLRFIREFVHSREMAAFVIRQVKLLGGASCAPFQMQVKVLCV